MARAVLVVCDGLRFDHLTPELTPNLARLRERASVYVNHRGVFPSTTRTTSASIATGCHPARHGLEGNCVALDEGEGLVTLSVGAADFRDRLERATGRTLKVPTLAERLRDHGGAIVFSNVSTGAAVFQDPDGHGHMYHRSLAYGPGRVPLEPLGVSHDAAGDDAMTTRFLDEVLDRRRPALAVLWQCEPDHTQHGVALGSPEHKRVIAAADANAGRVAAAVDAMNAGGEDVLLLIASDHGHETVSEIVDVDDLLIGAGLKDGPGSREVAVASQGLSATIYVAPAARGRIPAMVDLLRADARMGRVFFGPELAGLGLPVDGALAIAVTGRTDDGVNEYGVPGRSVALQGSLKISIEPGCGQHGGLGTFEQHPFLIAMGGGFASGREVVDPTSAVDLAPTILKHLGHAPDALDGRPLQ